jgi:hypothetical protein
MSAGLPSDEVVDDYKNSLDDLVTNDRISIGNLTVIAKECIEHAQAIARVLENHILRVGCSPFYSNPAVIVIMAPPVQLLMPACNRHLLLENYQPFMFLTRLRRTWELHTRSTLA